MRVIKPVALSSRCLYFILLFAMTVNTHAGEWECGERSNLPIEGKNFCAAGDFRLAEAKLQKAMARAVQRQTQAFGDASKLELSESAFKKYRDNHCLAENRRIKEEPFHPMVVAQCKTRLTKQRLQLIENLRFPESN